MSTAPVPPGGGREDVVLAGLLLLPAAGAAGALLELALKRRLASQQLLALDLTTSAVIRLASHVTSCQFYSDNDG